MRQLSHLTLLSEVITPVMKKGLENQLRIVLEKFDSKIKDNKCTPEEMFIKGFKLGINSGISPFKQLDSSFKIKFLCYFFFNFVDAFKTIFFFGEFWPDVKLVHEFNSIRSE